MSSPLIDRLNEQLGYPVLDAATLDAFLDHDSASVLFFSEDPANYPEANDVAVILPELMVRFAGRARRRGDRPHGGEGVAAALRLPAVARAGRLRPPALPWQHLARARLERVPRGVRTAAAERGAAHHADGPHGRQLNRHGAGRCMTPISR